MSEIFSWHLGVKGLPTCKILHKITCIIWQYEFIPRYRYHYRYQFSRRKSTTQRYGLHMMNAYWNVRDYFKRTSTTTCEIKTYTDSLQISPNITSMIWWNNSVIRTLNQSEAIIELKSQDRVLLKGRDGTQHAKPKKMLWRATSFQHLTVCT